MTSGDEPSQAPSAGPGDVRPASSCLRYERRGHVLVIRMEREAKRNAIDKALTRGIDEALNLLDDDDELWAGVITGTTTVFSAGTDLKDGSGRTERGGEYGMIRRRRAKPLIAAVEGPAFGGGFEIALACDLVVAARTARFALPESRRTISAPPRPSRSPPAWPRSPRSTRRTTPPAGS
jgi:enoyl-CoA hydratase/carnithine racemase